MRRNLWLLAAVFVAVAVEVIGAASVAMAASGGTQTHSSTHHSAVVTLPGTWSGKYSGAFSGTFTLHWKQLGSSLGGSITLSNPKGKYDISGSVHDSTIKFGAVAVGATYTGSVSGNKMSGSYKSPQGGGTWSASKTS
jgi:hypothetical protein